jgi:DNA-directed RNA polymerase subunit RPC12/RpoP
VTSSPDAIPQALPVTQKQFPCHQCGAKVDFQPGTVVLKCPYCGFENPIPQSEEQVLEIDYRTVLAQAASQRETREVLTVKCNACAAETTLPPNITAAACPYCGVNIVATAVAHTGIMPQALLPFHVTRDQALGCFRGWINSLWFAPRALQREVLADNRFTGLYVPFWTYDSDTTSFYRGERGDDYWVTEHYTTMENGKMVTRTRQVRRTRWTSVSGTVWNQFDDVLVLASRSLPRDKADKLEPWDLPALVPYRDDYLAGFRAERYAIDLQEGFEVAKSMMVETIQATIRADIGGDHQRIHAVKSVYANVTFKHILLPVWLSAYRYKQKLYQFMVNARTGEVQGERPWSVWKIVFTVLGGLALIGGALALFAAIAGR